MTIRTQARQEIAKRANDLVAKQFLAVNYYRIRKRLALPLPITEALSKTHTVRAFSSPYPWQIWLQWALEDRILALGEYVCQTSDSIVRRAVERDLSELAAWETYRETARPDLAYAHAVRVLWIAVTQWNWIDESVSQKLHQALLRAVEDALPFSDQLHGQFDSSNALLAIANPYQHLHNIPLIGTCALALAAKAVNHPASPKLNARVEQLFIAVLALRLDGFTEGVSYDGYVLSFIVDWVTVLDEAARKEVLSHPGFVGLVEQALELAVPGDVMGTAPLGDVEPIEMPFVWSALSKLQLLQSNPRVAWALAKCDVSRLRADALVALARMPEQVFVVPVVQSPAKMNYALVLRTGYASDDVAMAMGLSTSPMGHIQCDNGSLVLGTRGRWWLDDPGYQQYLQTAERRFTVGVTAHNAPVLNGHSQVCKRPELLELTRLSVAPDVQLCLVNLTNCYPAKAGVTNVCRAIWLVGNEHLVVCDKISVLTTASVAYHWHGHPSLYWSVVNGAATMVSDDDPDRWLHVFSPQIELKPTDLHRLPGSRGQQTLAVTLYPPREAAVWWVFSFAAERPVFELLDNAFQLGNHEVPLDERIRVSDSVVKPFSRTAPLIVTVSREGNLVKGQCVASVEYFDGELEYAFYLLVRGEKAQVHWYTSDPTVSFVVSDDVGAQQLEVRGFVREKSNPEKKLSRLTLVEKAR